MSTSKHTLYNLAGAVLPMALALGTIPVYIRLIGDARYGVLAVAWLLLDYFGFFDVGLGRAISQRVASLRDSNPAAIANSFWSAVVANVGIGVVGALVAWPVATYFFGSGSSIEQPLRDEVQSAIPWFVLAVPLITLSGVLTGALQGRGKFLELNLVTMLGSALIQIVPLLIAYFHGPDLGWLLPAVVSCKAATLVLLYWNCRLHVFKRQPMAVSGDEMRRLVSFGGWVAITGIISPLVNMVDRFAISALLGPRFVTYYSVPFQLVQRSAVIPGALASAMLPRFSVANARDATVLNGLATRSLAVVMTPVMLAAMFLIEPFISWWLNPVLAQNAEVLSKLLVLGFWINAFAFVPYVHIQASGRPDLVAKCHLGEIAPYLLVLYLGLQFFGLTGVAAACALRAAVDCLILTYLSGSFQQSVRVLKVPLALMVLGLGAAIIFPHGSTQWWVSSIGLIATSLFWSGKTMPAEMKIFLRKVCLASSK